jgi:hypothetical protein
MRQRSEAWPGTAGVLRTVGLRFSLHCSPFACSVSWQGETALVQGSAPGSVQLNMLSEGFN